jgi:hypothetical protein
MEKSSKKLKFVANFEMESWFIKNKYSDTAKLIGKKEFIDLASKNVNGCHCKNKKDFTVYLNKYIIKNKKDIIFEIKQKKKIIEKRWHKFEKKFFYSLEQITGVNWKYKNYKCYLCSTCFFGGDYDIQKPNIYINPLSKHGDPSYVIFHELSHLLFWNYVFLKYSKSFVKENYYFLWKLSEIMVNFPLLKLDLKFYFPLTIPEKLRKFGKPIVEKFSIMNFTDIIDSEIKNREEL